MKLFSVVLPLASFVALSVLASEVRADATLVYGTSTESEPGRKTAPSHQVHIRGGKVSIANAVDKRLLVFDAKTGRATVVDHGARQRADLDAESVERLAMALEETQRKVLAAMEDKLRDLPKKERDEMRRAMDLLHAAGAGDDSSKADRHRFVETGKAAVFRGMKVSGAEIQRGGKPWGKALLADREELGLSEEDHATLMAFQRFFDALTAALPGRMRQQFGGLNFVTAAGKMPVSLERKKSGAAATEDDVGADLELLRVDRTDVEDGWFRVPADYEEIPLHPVAGGGEERSGAGKSAKNTLEKQNDA